MDRLSSNTEERRPGMEGNSFRSNIHDSFESINEIKLYNRGRLNEMALGRNNSGVPESQNKYLPTSNEDGDFLKNGSTQTLPSFPLLTVQA